jgi:hypothetical protein
LQPDARPNLLGSLASADQIETIAFLGQDGGGIESTKLPYGVQVFDGSKVIQKRPTSNKRIERKWHRRPLFQN